MILLIVKHIVILFIVYEMHNQTNQFGIKQKSTASTYLEKEEKIRIPRAERNVWKKRRRILEIEYRLHHQLVLKCISALHQKILSKQFCILLDLLFHSFSIFHRSLLLLLLLLQRFVFYIYFV